MGRSRMLYAALLLLVSALAWVYGERLLYIALAVFAAMPAASFVITFVMLRLLRITQTVPHTVVKNEKEAINLRLLNPTPMPFGNVGCSFFTDDFAIETEAGMTLWLKPFQTANRYIPIHAKYRGVYRVGLQAVYAGDMMGLFRLKRTVNKKSAVNVLPRIVDMAGFPLAMNLLTQAHSRFDIKDEDYASISDIRPYIPTDSIKRVHWKLTAKRNEWLVKNFQSNALNKVTIILDTTRLPLRYKEQITLEDRIVELAVGLARFCLRKGMPVDFSAGEGHTLRCHSPSMFESVYQLGSGLTFTGSPPLTPHTMLSHYLNEAAGYLNVIVMTPRLDAPLYERIINGTNNGHYIAVLYFATLIKDPDSEAVYRLLSEGGMPCFRVTEESLVHEEAA
jgi:uncharacterized protein (DUF58 family)